MSIGLTALFGDDLWVPTGVNMLTVACRNAFLGLIAGGQINSNGTCANILALIPANTPNTFEFEPRCQRGFKFVWNDLNNILWQVHGHEADAGAAFGHVGGAGWTCRIRSGQDYLMSVPWTSPFPTSHANYLAPTSWKSGNSNWVIQHSHIPLTNV
jgi:hypothetical protein